MCEVHSVDGNEPELSSFSVPSVSRLAPIALAIRYGLGMGKKGRFAPKSVGREQRSRGSCGLCGQVGPLSKTHVPPRCAGNGGPVKRFRVVTDSANRATSGSKRVGGVHFFGLCVSCNTKVQGRWDGSYCEMARLLWPLATGQALVLPRVVTMPAGLVSPGEVARFVLAGGFALNPNMRIMYPEIADALIDDAGSISLPDQIALRLAITPGPMARVTGAMSGSGSWSSGAQQSNRRHVHGADLLSTTGMAAM